MTIFLGRKALCGKKRGTATCFGVEEKKKIDWFFPSSTLKTNRNGMISFMRNQLFLFPSFSTFCSIFDVEFSNSILEWRMLYFGEGRWFVSSTRKNILSSISRLFFSSGFDLAKSFFSFLNPQNQRTSPQLRPISISQKWKPK